MMNGSLSGGLQYSLGKQWRARRAEVGSGCRLIGGPEIGPGKPSRHGETF